MILRPPLKRLLSLTFLLLVAVGALLMTSTPMAAQETICELEPPTLPLWDATPPAVIAATPVITSGEVPTQDEVMPSIEQFFACSNTGNASLAYAIFTPRFLAEQFVDGSGNYLPGLEQLLSGNIAIEQTDELVLDEVADFAVLDDGRVQVTISYHNGTGEFRDTLVLAKVGEYWLIDGIDSLDPTEPSL